MMVEQELKECEYLVRNQIESIRQKKSAVERERAFWELISSLLTTQQMLLARIRGELGGDAIEEKKEG